MNKHRQTSNFKKMLAWLLMMVMMCTSVCTPALASEFSSGVSTEWQNTDENTENKAGGLSSDNLEDPDDPFTDGTVEQGDADAAAAYNSDTDLFADGAEDVSVFSETAESVHSNEETGEGTEITVRMTAQNGNTFLCAPYLSLNVNSNLSDQYGFVDNVTDGVSALDALIAAHVQKYGESFTKDGAGEYLAVDENGAVTKMFATTAQYGIGLTVNYTAQNSVASNLSLSNGAAVTFFCYSSADKVDKIGKFANITGKTVIAEKTMASAFDCMVYVFCDGTATNGLQLAAVNAETGEITALEGYISNEFINVKGTKYNGHINIKNLEVGNYLLTVYDPNGGTVMPLMTYRAAKTPYIESCDISVNGTVLEMTPEWNPKVLTGYKLSGKIPDSTVNFGSKIYVSGNADAISSTFSYDDITYSLKYARGGGMESTNSNQFPSVDGLLKIRLTPYGSNIDNVYEISTEELQYETTLSALTVSANSVTYNLNEALAAGLKEYTVMIPAEAKTVSITPTAYRTDYDTYVNGEKITYNTAKELEVQWDQEDKMTVTIQLDPGNAGENYCSSTYTLTLYKKNTETTPVFTEQPKNVTYEVGDTAAPLSVMANASGTVIFLWYKIDDPKNFDAAATTGGGTSTGVKGRFYTPSTTAEGTYYYYCRVMNKDSGTNYYGFSEIATVTVTNTAEPTITITNEVPTITEGELNGTKGYLYTYGDTGETLNVQCNANVDGEWSNGRWIRIDGSKKSILTANDDGSYTIDSTAPTGDAGCYYQYFADFTAKNGKIYQDVASEKVFTFIKISDASQVPVPIFRTQPPVSEEYTIGSEINFFKNVTADAAVGTLTYQWYINYINDYNDADALEGMTQYQMKPSTENSGVFYYFCQVTNTVQGYTATANSNMYVVTVLEKVQEIEAKLSMKGSGTEEDPYLIETAAHYQEIYDAVASGDFFYEKYFKQTADITLPDNWKPIGNNKRYRFKGTIDGGNYTITIPEDGLPLLGYVQYATVKNLNIYGKKIAGYGLVNNFEGVGYSGSAIVIDHVTLKSGSSTLESGLIGANITENMFAGVSNGFYATITNCTIEEGVVIGYNKDQTMIGSIAGRMQGYVENCVSYATVYGVNYVGGIIGTRDNAMGPCTVNGCTFGGSVNATGDHVGGIAGGGYENSTAPNAIRINMSNNTVTGSVAGKDKVGGILGGDTYVAQAWNTYSISGNSFTGTIKAEGNYIGGIIGYYHSLNMKDNISGNYYSASCGAEKGIGYVKYVDTSCTGHESASGATYINTAFGTASLPYVEGCAWRENYNRTDDPLGADAEKLATSNANAAPVVTKLTISGNYKREYYRGQDFDFSGMEFTATWSNQSVSHPTADEMTVTGFDSSKAGEQEVVISYQGVSATVTVKVRKSMKVTFSLLGDSAHDSDKDGIIHTLQMNNLETWVPETVYYYTDLDTTVKDVLEDAAEQYDFEIGSRSTQYGYYVESITWKGQKLSEKDNGENSGWMYTVNGIHPDVGVGARYVEDGDVIIFHYTDDYAKEESLLYDKSQAEEITQTIAALPSTDKLTAKDKEKVQAARTAYEALTDTQKALVSAETLKLLEAVEARIAELERSEHVCTWDKGTVTKAAICTKTGIMTYKCSCGKTKTETIPALGHKFGKWKNVSDATVKRAKVQKHTCTVCGVSKTREVGDKLTPVLELPGKLSSLKLKKGKTVTMSVTMAKGDSVSRVKSSNSKTLKATLDKKTGKITLKALKTGTVKLTIRLASGKSRTYKVNVITGTVKTTGITVSGLKDNKLSLAKGKTYNLKVTVKPFTSSQKVTYKSSDEKVATVTSSGKIKGIKKGTAKITIQSGDYKKTIKVTVTK